MAYYHQSSTASYDSYPHHPQPAHLPPPHVELVAYGPSRQRPMLYIADEPDEPDYGRRVIYVEEREERKSKPIRNNDVGVGAGNWGLLSRALCTFDNISREGMSERRSAIDLSGSPAPDGTLPAPRTPRCLAHTLHPAYKLAHSLSLRQWYNIAAAAAAAATAAARGQSILDQYTSFRRDE
ncbi:hypothetical protein B0T17DRAFT_617007 [Bombardia bombarda]|uniref:Uncharacterized protein n=1 Tax=Bombardia bombarda TaxID=252184 RepID=A0AA40C4L9_9PEZI|nr:hypothetical protein B0T17DRAFT_617007 [Bombardia bombarda]